MATDEKDHFQTCLSSFDGFYLDKGYDRIC